MADGGGDRAIVHALVPALVPAPVRVVPAFTCTLPHSLRLGSYRRHRPRSPLHLRQPGRFVPLVPRLISTPLCCSFPPCSGAVCALACRAAVALVMGPHSRLVGTSFGPLFPPRWHLVGTLRIRFTHSFILAPSTPVDAFALACTRLRWRSLICIRLHSWLTTLEISSLLALLVAGTAS